MTSVWYTGLSDTRTVYSRDWDKAGAPGSTVTWDRTNGYSHPSTEFTAGQLAVLDADQGFWVGAPDGPRTVPASVDQVVTYQGLNEYLSKPGAVPGLNKTTVGLPNVDNTADVDKPVSTAQAAADNLRVLRPSGGNTGQVLALGTDGTVGWVTPAAGSTITQVPDSSVPSGFTYTIG